MRILLIAFLCAAAAHAQVPPPTRQVPPKGVTIPEADQQELEAGAMALRKEIDAVAQDPRAKPEIRALLPDVEIFWKAIDWPVRYGEFFDVKQVATAKNLLKEGLARALALREGKAPWTTVTGPVVRGYRSKIDGSAQPYGLLVPASWKPGDARPRTFHVWNHGRGDTLSELAFIGGAMKKVGEFNPDDAFVLAPYGRYCNATKFAGETDVFEAMDHVRANFPIDPNRIVMAGFSMGGASIWHLATHHAGLFVAASPGAGFAETPVYAKVFDPKKEPPPWWEQVLWRLYNATDYAANLANTHLIAYSGEVDPQKQSADVMREAMEREGLKLEELVGPKVGHKYEPETKKELAKRLDSVAAKGREEFPAKVRLVTYTLRYPVQKWVRVHELERHWERAEVNAEIVDEGTIRATTKNVAALQFEMSGTVPLDSTRPPRVVLDGQELVGSPVGKSSWSTRLHKQNGKWQVASTNAAPTARKRPGLQGPIDDAFTDSFVFVRPTGKPLNPTVGAWVQSEWERAVPQWRTVFRGDVRTVDDTAVTPELIASANLILWGDPSSNAVLAKVLPDLPLEWNAQRVAVGTASYSAVSHVPILIYPNPLNPARYVVLNSSFTFRQGSNTTNALQTPNLPDWALVDLRTPPSAKWPGLVVDAGFFDEGWNVPK